MDWKLPSKEETMKHGKMVGIVSAVFFVLFLCVSLPIAQSAEEAAPAAATTVTSEANDNCPKITVKMGAMFLRRGDNHDNRLVNWADAGGPGDMGIHARVYSDDLDLGWAPGMDASIMIQNPTFGIEARYMGLTEWNESKNDSVVNLEFGDGVYAGAKMKSKLSNVELNLHWWPCANEKYSLIAGFRWLRLTDRLMFGWEEARRYGDDYDFGEGNMSSRNNLYGGQIGIEGLLFGKRDKGFSLDGSVKTGFYANNITNQYSEYEYDDGYWGWSGKQKSTRGVNLSELGINLNYAFTKNIAMTIGYELLYISRIATPANDWGGTQSVLYQGSRVGLNFMF